MTQSSDCGSTHPLDKARAVQRIAELIERFSDLVEQPRDRDAFRRAMVAAPAVLRRIFPTDLPQRLAQLHFVGDMGAAFRRQASPLTGRLPHPDDVFCTSVGDVINLLRSWQEEVEDWSMAIEHDEDGPPKLFLGMAFGQPDSKEVYEVVRDVCEELGIVLLLAHQDNVVGSHNIDDIVHCFVDNADFAIIDLSHGRDSVSHELGLVDRELERDTILLVAREGTPRFGNIQARMTRYYKSAADLRQALIPQLEAMLEAWDDSEYEEEEEEDEEWEED